MRLLDIFCNKIFFCLLFFVQVLLLVLLSYQTSYNRTEVGHLGAAVYFYKAFRFDVFHVNPPLTRYIVGLPVILTNPKYDWKSYSPRPQDRSEWRLGNTFITINSPEKIHWCIFLSRCCLIPFILVGSWFGYKFATEVYGCGAGIIFLILWVFSPLVLGWGATICPDVCAASLGIVGVYMFWHWLKNPLWTKTIVSGVCLGLLPLAKITWIVAFPLWLFIWIIWVLPYFISRNKTEDKIIIPPLRQLVTIFLIGLYTLNMGYFFDGTFRLLGDYKFISHTLTGAELRDGNSASPQLGNRFEKSLIGYIPVPLPSEFVQGIDTQKLDFERGIESYLCGQYSQHGWFSYYVYVILLKEPFGVLCLIFLVLVATCFFRRYNTDWRTETIIILPAIALFIFISSQTGFSLHPRYIILVLPFIYIWISKLGRAFLDKRYFISTITVCLLFWVASSSLYYFPYSMAYFNELTGGAKNAPKLLLGSNIDWGQNAYFIKRWYDKHPEIRPIKIAYLNSESLDRLGIKDNKLPPDKPESGWFIIGVNEIYNNNSKQYEYFKRLEPVDIIGNSIYIYHITPEDEKRIKKEMRLTELNEKEKEKEKEL
jgi:hypothetical protein